MHSTQKHATIAEHGNNLHNFTAREPFYLVTLVFQYNATIVSHQWLYNNYGIAILRIENMKQKGINNVRIPSYIICIRL